MLRSSPAKLKPFEANRVSEIITLLPKVRWQYVPSAENPADCATRGLSAEALKQFTLWWTGPPCLQDKVQWPSQLDLTDNVSLTVSTPPVTEAQTTVWVDRYQSLNRLVRVTARSLRWFRRQPTAPGGFNTFKCIRA